MPLYDRRCLGLSPEEVESRMAAGEPAAIRLRVPDGEVCVDDLIRGPVTFASEVIGDFIIVRSDGLAAYNFAAVVDDRDMAITHVIRGDDHLTNTARQLMLFAALESAAATIRSSLAHPGTRRRQALQAPRRHRRGRVPRARLSAAGDHQLPRSALLVARRRGGHASGAAGRRVRSRRARVQPRRVRPGEAGLARPPAHPRSRPGRARAPLRGAPACGHAAAGRDRLWRRRSSLRWSPTVRPRRSRRRCSSGRSWAPALRPALAAAAPWLRSFRDLRAAGARVAYARRRRATFWPRTGSWAIRPASRRASCSCPCAWRSPAASMGPSCTTCWPPWTGTRPLERLAAAVAPAARRSLEEGAP